MKIIIYDASDKSLVGWSWAVGVRLFCLLGLAKHYVAARSWQEALHGALDIAVAHRVTQIEYWGHGAPGQLVLAGRLLARSGPEADLLGAVGALLEPGALVWFRTCASFAGLSGQSLASALAAALNCRVAGSTYNIGFPWHSGQRSLRPGATPAWSDTEGLEGNRPLWSKYRAPNTVGFWAQRLPEDW
jgi:hypothetical protein